MRIFWHILQGAILVAAAGCGSGGARGQGGELVAVPAGGFQMGCDAVRDPACLPYELPYHRVDLSAYSIGRSEVTQAEYAACLDAGACPKPECGFDPAGDPKRPVVCINHGAAQAYCRHVGNRLCTEAEWERAARGADGALFPWGDAAADCQRAVMDEGGDGCGLGSSAAVGSKPAGESPCGAWDMAGNVSEWTADWFDAGYYASSPDRDPRGPGSGSARVIRGGAFTSTADYLRASYRAQADPRFGYHDLGLRCCR